MHAVILSFPGHFYQTHLTVRSLIAHYPEVQHITFILDDVQVGPWIQYVNDFDSSIRSMCPRSFDIKTVSTIPHVADCVAGWWRQQLVKLTLDLYFPEDSWFVVDGDVIFYTRCDVQNMVPISRAVNTDSSWSRMCMNYVENLLGVEPGYILEQGQRLGTSPVPFRYLDRNLLQELRYHIETRHGKNFLQAHLDWFADQTIVANWDPPDRWVMSEWELIECFRRYVKKQLLPIIDVGSGYKINVDINQKKNIFLHSYQRDPEIPGDWFHTHGIEIHPDIWSRICTWYDHYEGQSRQ
jgi:hypothetical protein